MIGGPAFLRSSSLLFYLIAYQGIIFFIPFFLLLDSLVVAGGSVVLVVPLFEASVDGVVPSAAVVPVLVDPSVGAAVVVPFAVLSAAAGSVELLSPAGAPAVVSSLAPLVFVGCAGAGSPGFTVSITAFDPGAPPPFPMLDALAPVNVSVPG
jgi:hypothetical protein